MKYIKIATMLIMAMTIQFVAAQESEQFYYSKTVKGSFEQISNKTKSLLKEQGFSAITEIDMDVKLKEKLKDVEMRPYKILGFCNPAFAYRTLQLEENIGVFLPCKAIVKDIGAGNIEVVIVNPTALMGMLNNKELVIIAKEVSVKFQAAIEKL